MSGIGLLRMAGGSVLAATASPPDLSSGGRGGSHTTEATTAIPSGGSGTYTYSWAISGANYPTVVNSPALATTTFGISGVAHEDTAIATATCTITDSVTTATTTVSVPISSARSALSGNP